MDRLIRSSAEPGHPWSCSGGLIDLELTPSGATLRVAREGEPPVTRQVAAPDDVVPLGQALLAAPLAPLAPSPERRAAAEDEVPSPARAAPSPVEPPPPRSEAPPETARTNTASSPKEARIIVGAGIDGRALGSSGGAWLGPTLNAAVPMGLWLPGISLRQQSGILADGPPIDEVSVALSVQRRFSLRAIELRAGLALRGAVVLRDLPRPQGSQSQLQARIGAVLSVVIPVVRWASLVISADGDAVAISRKTADPTTTSSAPRAFPTYTLGGSAGVEVPL